MRILIQKYILNKTEINLNIRNYNKIAVPYILIRDNSISSESWKSIKY